MVPPEKYPLLHYILSQHKSNTQLQPGPGLLLQMPHLTHPQVVQSMTNSVSDIIQSQSLLLKALGDRPTSDTVDAARAKISEIETKLGNCEETGERTKEEVERELQVYKAVVRLDQMHREYDEKLNCTEERLAEVYPTAVDQEVSPGVAEVLEKVAMGEALERIEMPGRKIRAFPEGFGRIQGLVVLNLSNNLLQLLPDSIAGLQKLELLNVSSNLLESLPESIGKLVNLKVLDVSGNKLNYLPDTTAGCSNLEELNASFNNLTCLPINIGYGLKSLKKLSIYLNKIQFLPPSLCEIEALQYLDAHFNELNGIPNQIRKLMNLRVLDVSRNFSDLTELPDSFCDLIDLRELDLSNNQIRYLPDEFFRLENLEKLNLDENPLIIPPLEVAREGAVSVRAYMSKRWQKILVEDDKRNKQGQGGRWLGWNTTWWSNMVSGISESLLGYIGDGKRYRDPMLDQQL